MAKQMLAESTATASLMQPYLVVVICQFWWDLLSRQAPHEKDSEGIVKALVYVVMQTRASHHVEAYYHTYLYLVTYTWQ